MRFSHCVRTRVKNHKNLCYTTVVNTHIYTDLKLEVALSFSPIFHSTVHCSRVIDESFKTFNNFFFLLTSFNCRLNRDRQQLQQIDAKLQLEYFKIK